MTKIRDLLVFYGDGERIVADFLATVETKLRSTEPNSVDSCGRMEATKVPTGTIIRFFTQRIRGSSMWRSVNYRRT